MHMYVYDTYTHARTQWCMCTKYLPVNNIAYTVYVHIVHVHTYYIRTYIDTHVYMFACTYIHMYIISMHKCIHFKMVQTCSAKASWYSFFRLSWFLTNSLWSACSLQSGKDGDERGGTSHQ